MRRPRGEREVDKIVAQIMENSERHTLAADEGRQKFVTKLFTNSNPQQQSSSNSVEQTGTFKVSLIDPVGLSHSFLIGRK